MTTKKVTVLPTLAQLQRFIRLRNRSPYSSNLQFQIDADDCGFDAAALGTPQPYVPDETHATAWHWDTPHGTLIEADGRIRLEPGR